MRASVPLQDVAIVGGGFCGAMVAAHLSREAKGARSIVLIERSGRVAQGVAYATTEPDHLLNVSADRMSAFPDDPAHFERWLAAGGFDRTLVVDTACGVFVARMLYGRYLQETFQAACRAPGERARVAVVQDEAVAIAREEQGFRIVTASGACCARHVALALGNLVPRTSEPRIIRNPWSPAAVEDLDSGRPVLIVGTGLTMVDVVLSLERRGFRGPILAVSRRGLTPRPLAPGTPREAPAVGPDELRRLSRLLRRMRAEARAAETAGGSWQDAMDSLRVIVAHLWQQAPRSERARFLRHLRPWFGAHRHRIPPPVAARLDALRCAGRLQVVAGRIVGMTPGTNAVEVTLRRRGAAEVERLAVQRAIDARGPESVAASKEPFLRSLLASGLARADSFGLGLDVDTDLAVLDRHGRAVPGLWALGPIVKGVFYDYTAVPAIRWQAAALAARIGERLHPDRPLAKPAALR